MDYAKGKWRDTTEQHIESATKGNNKKVSGKTENNKNSWKFNNKNKMECYTEDK